MNVEGFGNAMLFSTTNKLILLNVSVSVCSKSSCGTWTHDLRLRKRQRVVAHRHVVDARAVELLRLEEDARVRVADAREQEALRLIRAARDHNLRDDEAMRCDAILTLSIDD